MSHSVRMIYVIDFKSACVVWKKANVIAFTFDLGVILFDLIERKHLIWTWIVCFQSDGWRGGVCSAAGVSSVWTVMGGVRWSSGIYRQNPSNSRKVWNMQDSPTTCNHLLHFLWCHSKPVWSYLQHKQWYSEMQSVFFFFFLPIVSKSALKTVWLATFLKISSFFVLQYFYYWVKYSLTVRSL